MRFLRGLLSTLTQLAVLAIGLNWALAGVFGLPANPIFGWLDARAPESLRWMFDPETARWYGWLLVVLVVGVWTLGLVVWTRRSKPLRIRSTAGHTMNVHPGALVKFVEMQLRGHAAVEETRQVRIRQSGSNSLSIQAEVLVKPIESLPVIDEQLKATLRDSLSTVMGVDKLDDVRLTLAIDEKSINLRPGPAVIAAPAPEPPPRGALEEESAARPLAEVETPAPAAATEEVSGMSLRAEPRGEAGRVVGVEDESAARAIGAAAQAPGFGQLEPAFVITEEPEPPAEAGLEEEKLVLEQGIEAEPELPEFGKVGREDAPADVAEGDDGVERRV